MEDKTRFDLENALRAWRKDFGSRPGVLPEDTRELESDLRERVAILQNQGFGEDEAFQEALRQIGSPAALGREFARENPWPIWRERLLWMAVAGFAVWIWRFMFHGMISWFVSEFWELLPIQLPSGAWITLAVNLPVLAVAILLAKGRLTGNMQYILQSRPRLTVVGLTSLLVSILILMFGPGHLSLPKGSLSTTLMVLSLCLWPLILLSVGVFLLPRTDESPGLRLDVAGDSAIVWRERVCWMALGGLLFEVWQTLGGFTTRAILRPTDVPLVISLNLLFELSPVIALVILHRRVKNWNIPRAVARTMLMISVTALLCAWLGLNVWTLYVGMPRGVNMSFAAVMKGYFTSFHWFWPACLAALALWLAPWRCHRQAASELAK